jgi:hypothetical protein
MGICHRFFPLPPPQVPLWLSKELDHIVEAAHGDGFRLTRQSLVEEALARYLNVKEPEGHK